LFWIDRIQQKTIHELALKAMIQSAFASFLNPRARALAIAQTVAIQLYQLQQANL
jgi:hypothetical protein